MMREQENLPTILDFMNPGRKSLRVNTIIPMTQKVFTEESIGVVHIVAYPEIHPDNYIFNSFLGGDIVLGRENGVENSILIGNGQVIKFGRYNSLQNLEAHGSDIREVGVEWGDGNFIAHRAIFHGCKGGDRNYLGVGNIIADLSHAGSENYFYHGSTVGFKVQLQNRMAYRGSYISDEGSGKVGCSETAIEFENQRTDASIPLGQLFHDPEFTFMRNVIVPRTRNLLAHLSYTLGGYLTGQSTKQPAHGVMLQPVLSAGEYFHGVFSKLAELHDRELALEITNIQRIYTLMLDGTTYDSLDKDAFGELEKSWIGRHSTYEKGFKLLNELGQNLNDESRAGSGPYLLIGPHPEKRFSEYKKAQMVVVIDYAHNAIPHVVITKEDIAKCEKNIIESDHVVSGI